MVHRKVLASSALNIQGMETITTKVKTSVVPTFVFESVRHSSITVTEIQTNVVAAGLNLHSNR